MNAKVVMMTASSIAVVAAKKAEEVKVEPEVSPFDMLKPLLLEPQAEATFFWVALFGYCLAVALAVSANAKPKNFYQGWLLCCLTGYGGGTLVPMLCGKPGVLIGKEWAVTMAGATWFLVYNFTGALNSFKASLPGKLFLSCTFETFRCRVMMNTAAMAIATLGPNATVGPLVCGLLGGVGGGFMPLNVGVAPLDNGTNWRMRSATVFTFWMRALLDATTSPYVLPIFKDEATGRAFGVFLVVLMPILSILVPGFGGFLGANPLAPKAAAASKEKKDK